MKKLMVILCAMLMVFEVVGISDGQAVAYTFSTIEYPGAFNTAVRDINNAGHIVGSYSDGSTWHGFLYDGNNYTSLDYPESFVTEATGINNQGNIVGIYDHKYSFFYDKNNYSTIISYADASGLGINDANHIVGAYNQQKSFLYDGSAFTILEFPYSSITLATDINNAGQIVGNYKYGSGFYGFLYDDGNYTPINYPGFNPMAFGINNAGQIVGDYWDHGSHGFLFDGNDFITIDHPESPYRTHPLSINDNGYIVGQYYGDDGIRRSFLASPNPIPEPTTMLLLASGLVGLAGFRRKFRKK